MCGLRKEKSRPLSSYSRRSLLGYSKLPFQRHPLCVGHDSRYLRFRPGAFCRTRAIPTSPMIPQVVKPTVRPKNCEIPPMLSGPSISPTSLKEPAPPRLEESLPALARSLTMASQLVHTTPTPKPPAMIRPTSKTPCVKTNAIVISADQK
jgi:hypothetical protein